MTQVLTFLWIHNIYSIVVTMVTTTNIFGFQTLDESMDAGQAIH